MKNVIPIVVLLFSATLYAQTGSVNEPVRYIGGVTIDPSVHEGRLRYAIGTESRQTFRANRSHPVLSDGFGWTYSHASNLAYWNNTFFQQYLSNPVDEHIAPGQTLMVTSKDGRTWSKPEVIFPPYDPPKGVKIPEGYDGYMMHQRMGFYVTSDQRLLTLAFYGHTEDPFEAGGIGRVVREIYNDGSLGPIYFIRYTSHADWNETNTSFPFYKKAKDKGFIKACDELLNNKLITMQWWDEDRGLDGFYSIDEAREALSYYHRKDGKVVALWKWSMFALSDDGVHFSKPTKSPTLLMAGGKQWGQQTDDGGYAIVYNPIENQEYRYPLITITSDDGILFDNMVLVQGEVPPRRFYGRWKDFGPCYVRGIVKGNGNPPGDDMWLTYSMNKEDIWISRVPTPVSYAVKGDIDENFDQLTAGGAIPHWNVYSPLWAPVNLLKSDAGLSMQLKDKDPYDYARAIRVFEESNESVVSFKVKVVKAQEEPFEVDVTDQYGNRPVRVSFNANGDITALDGGTAKKIGSFSPDSWMNVKLIVRATPYGSYDILVDGQEVGKRYQLAEAVKSVERISFRTGPYRDLPNRKTPNETPEPPLPGADDAVAESIYLIDDFVVEKVK